MYSFPKNIPSNNEPKENKQSEESSLMNKFENSIYTNTQIRTFREPLTKLAYEPGFPAVFEAHKAI